MNRAVLGAGSLFVLMVVALVIGLAGSAPGLIMVSLLCLWPALAFVGGRLSTQYTFKRLEKTEIVSSRSRRIQPAQQYESLS